MAALWATTMGTAAARAGPSSPICRTPSAKPILALGPSGGGGVPPGGHLPETGGPGPPREALLRGGGARRKDCRVAREGHSPLITCADGSRLREAFGGVGAGNGDHRGRRSPLPAAS